jgi:CBS domain containing-hemolysin-like protein
MPRGPYETLAGLVLARLGRLAETGDTVTVDGWTLTVTFVQRRRIEAVTLTVPTAGEQQR